MKTYYADYLPIEGIAQIGDIVLWKGGYLEGKYVSITQSNLFHAQAMRWDRQVLFIFKGNSEDCLAQVLKGSSIKFGQILTEEQLEEHQFELDYI